ncbi:hypothetical protein PR048_032567 [Dryococelus australis]|uniref:Uncharacterized protein n=1 Tax=Dryococelus australis TaxID=614101 RepID=A0ABQ9G2J7_9NEOP|nr:hypothetical protein PR048_032567 [Dryococelus australis]
MTTRTMKLSRPMWKKQGASQDRAHLLPPHLPKRKKATPTDKNSMMIEKAYETLSKNEDEFDVFGAYVASEMRQLSTVALKQNVKTQIQRIILQASEEEMRNADTTTAHHPWTVATEYIIDDSVQSSELVIHGGTSQRLDVKCILSLPFISY